MLRAWAAPRVPRPLNAGRTAALDALVIDWHGQGPVPLPGGVSSAGHLGHSSWAENLSRHHDVAPTDAGPANGLCRRRNVSELDADIEETLDLRRRIRARIAELAVEIDADYAGREPMLVGVLKGAAMFMSDLARALDRPSTMEFMAVSSYGSGTQSSGVVRILKDLDRDIAGQDVLIVEDIIDSGLTLSWLLKNLRSRNPASIEIVTLLRKPEAAQGRRLGRSTSASTSRTSSSSGTAWTTPSATATCPTSDGSSPLSTGGDVYRQEFTSKRLSGCRAPPHLSPVREGTRAAGRS